MSNLLVYNPKKRPNPLVALQDRYFDELRDKNTRLPNGNYISSTLFEFTDEEIEYTHKIGQPDLIPKLIPDWFRSNN